MAIATFKYLNHRGVVAARRVEMYSIDFQKNPGFGYQPGWFLTGMCLDKNEIRSFALTHIILRGDNIAPPDLFRIQLRG